MESLESKAEKIFKESVAACVVALAQWLLRVGSWLAPPQRPLPPSHSWRGAVGRVQMAEVLSERGQITVSSHA